MFGATIDIDNINHINPRTCDFMDLPLSCSLPTGQARETTDQLLSCRLKPTSTFRDKFFEPRTYIPNDSGQQRERDNPIRLLSRFTWYLQPTIRHWRKQVYMMVTLRPSSV